MAACKRLETIPKLLENREGTVYTIVKRTSVRTDELVNENYPWDISYCS